MKLGLLHPGSARRLLSLPPGNQLELAAVVGSAGLGPAGHGAAGGPVAPDEGSGGAADAALRAAGEPAPKHHPETRRSPLDPRLSPEGQRLCRCLHRFEAVATETSRRLRSAARRAKDLEILSARASEGRRRRPLGSRPSLGPQGQAPARARAKGAARPADPTSSSGEG